MYLEMHLLLAQFHLQVVEEEEMALVHQSLVKMVEVVVEEIHQMVLEVLVIHLLSVRHKEILVVMVLLEIQEEAVELEVLVKTHLEVHQEVVDQG